MSSRPARTRRVALAIGLIGAVIGFAPVQAAWADDPMPALTVGSVNLQVYGPSVPLDVTVTAPASSDAYIKLSANGNLHFTDDAGNPLPTTQTTTGQVVTIGAEDSDGNGIPGAPLPAQTFHLHVTADYGADMGDTSGQIIDGATGKAISNEARGLVGVAEGHMDGQYQNGGRWYLDGSGLPVTTGAAYALTQDESTSLGFSTAPATSHMRLAFTAQQLADAGYTPQQVASALRIDYSSNGTTFTRTDWTTGDDGSVSLDFPAHAWAGDYSKPLDETLRIWAAWGLPAGNLTGELTTLGPDGREYARDTEPLKIVDNVRPDNLQAAFYGIDAGGQLWQYRGAQYVGGHAYYDLRKSVGGGWNTYTAITPLSPLKANGTGDMVARDSAGVLWLYKGTGTLTRPFDPRTRIGAGWNMYNQLTGAGDLTGDGRADLLARDTSGVLWLYQGTGSTTAPFAVRTRIGAGWNAYDLLTQAGDLTGDGHADLLARDTTGALWLYQGTGNATAPYAPRVRIGTGWGIYTHIVGVGDLLADGHPDILATDKTGQLWYYAGTGNAAAPYKPRAAAGTGWGIYTTLL